MRFAIFEQSVLFYLQLWQQPDQSTTSRGVVIGTEDGDSPVLRSGDMLQPPRSPTPVYVPRSENTFEKRKIKKFRSKKIAI